MADFNSIANDYKRIMDDTLAIKGSNLHEYFAEYKCFYIKQYTDKYLKKGVLKLLDYGCGIGLLALEIQHAFSSEIIIHGYDISEESIKMISPELKNGETVRKP